MTTTYTTHFRFPMPDFLSGPWHQTWYDSVNSIDRSLYEVLLGTGIVAWANSTVYALAKVVIDPVDGSLWVAAAAHTSAASPTTFAADRAAHPTYWTPLSPGVTFATQAEAIAATDNTKYMSPLRVGQEITGAALTLSNKTIDNSNSIAVKDASFTLQDDGDITKQAKFQLSGISAGQTRTLTLQDASGTLALTSNKLSAFAATTSLELASVISDETGTGLLVFADSPTFTTKISVTGSISATGSDANFSAGNQRAVIDIANQGANNASVRIGAVNGGSGFTTYLHLYSNQADALSWDSTNNATFNVGGAVVTPVIGGSAVGSSLELRSTVAVGTTDFIKFTVGNNGATEAMRILHSGGVSIGTIADPGAGVLNTLTGFRIGNLAASGKVLRGDGTNFISASVAVGDISGFGSGVASFLATPSSANLLAAVTDETGTGSLVFATSPGFTTAANPISSDGAALGTAALQWSDLFLAAGGVINWANGGITITESGDVLQFASATSYSFGGTGATVTPSTNDGAVLGTTALNWSDLFLASGAVINWNNGDVTLTHSANLLAFAGATGGYTFDVAINAASGGTGNSSYAIGDILYASAATTLSKLADVATGNALISGGVTTAPSWGKIGLTTHVSGTLAVGSGGTGQTTLAVHGVLVGNAASGITTLAAAAAGTVLTGQGTGSDPSFTATPTLGVAGTTKGTLAFAGNTSGTVTIQPAAAAGTWTMTLPTSAGANLQFLQTDGSGITTWANASGAGGSVTLLTTLTASSSATLDDTTHITSTYDYYIFELRNLVPATNNTGLMMRFGTGGGPTYQTTSYVSTVEGTLGDANIRNETLTTGIILTGANAAFDGVSNSASLGVSGTIHFHNPNTADYKYVTGTTAWYSGNAARMNVGAVGGVYNGATSAITAVRFMMQSGNITSGTIKIYGVST